MDRDACQKWLKELASIIADRQLDVSILIELVREFRQHVVTELESNIKHGTKSSELLAFLSSSEK